MLELNLKLFMLINATSDTALWLFDWGRFLTWWPQLFAVVGVPILLLRKNSYGLEWIALISAAVFTAIGLNHLMSWAYPTVLPISLDIGQLWMKGASFGNWMGDYPVFLPTFSIACVIWNKGSLFTGWTLLLTLANAWALLFVGFYFPSQILLSVIIGLAAVGSVVCIQWFYGRIGEYVLRLRGLRSRLGAV